MIRKLLVSAMVLCLFVGIAATETARAEFPVFGSSDVVRALNLIRTKINPQDSAAVSALDSVYVWAVRVDGALTAVDSLSDDVVALAVLVESTYVKLNNHLQADSLHFYANADSIAAGVGVGKGSAADAVAIATRDTVGAGVIAANAVSVGAITAPTAIDSATVNAGVTHSTGLPTFR